MYYTIFKVHDDFIIPFSMFTFKGTFQKSESFHTKQWQLRKQKGRNPLAVSKKEQAMHENVHKAIGTVPLKLPQHRSCR